MSVPERPDENVEWAESPHAEVEEPEELRLYGWPYGFVPPSAVFNWLQRSVGRWIQWLEAKVDGHVHDGGSDPGSVAKVDVKEHLGWGEHGFFEVVIDSIGFHRVEHHHRDGNPMVAEFSSDVLQSRRLLQFPGGEIQQIPFSDDVMISLDAQNAKLIFNHHDIEVPNAEIGGDIKIGGHAEIGGAVTAQNTAKAFVSFDVSGAIIASHGVDEVIPAAGAGVYFVKLSDPPPPLQSDDIVALATVRSVLENNEGFATADPEYASGGHITVVTHDKQGNRANRPVSLVAYW